MPTKSSPRTASRYTSLTSRRQEPGQVGLVERAGRAEVAGDPLAVTGEAAWGLRVLAATSGQQPARRGEVVERNDRGEAVLAAGCQDAPVVLQGDTRELAPLRLDARPLHREAIGVEAQAGQQADVLPIEVVVVAGVAGGFGEDRLWQMLEQLAIAIDVVALDLVSCGSGAPEKSIWKGQCHRSLSFENGASDKNGLVRGPCASA